MPTVHEVLKASGMSDSDIASLDAKALTGLGGVLTAAEAEKKAATDALAKAETDKKAAAEAAVKAEEERKAALQAKEAAELAQRSNVEFYDTRIAPALDGWEKKQKELESARGNATAEAAFYKAQVEGAKAAGYIPTDAPAFALPTPPPEPQRDPSTGRFVAGQPGATPGSPVFTPEQLDERLGQGFSNFAWATQEYQRLTGGQFMPDPVELLAKEANERKLPFRDYVSRKYDFASKQQAIQQRLQQEHDDKIRAEANAPWEAKLAEQKKLAEETLKAREREIAERYGNNPDVRALQPSRFADVQRAVKAGERPDPLSLNEAQRRAQTSAAIRQEISTNAVQ